MKLHDQLIERRAILEKAGQTLKSEFIGLDKVIDDVIESVSSWFLFPNLQDRPVIVNLWGMTGVGKSSLVKRLTQLIGFSNKYYRFDIGEKSNSEWVVKRNLTDIYDRENGKPVILAFDEFQHARTKDADGNEIDQVSSRIVWELLDSGKFQSSQVTKGISDLYELQQRLFGLLQRGVTVKNGVITRGHESFIREFQSDFSFFNNIHQQKPKKGERVFFVHDNYIEYILWIMREDFTTQLDVRSHLQKLNGVETIQFLKKVMELGLAPKTIDCSRSLVFVIGNLDEVYRMSADMNPDIDADTFYLDSLKINVSHVKRALRSRFRNEQIARLGNTHIIYPAVTTASFRAIIRKELTLIETKMINELGIEFRFDDSVTDAVYREGVFPSQGIRPLFTTINQLITSKLGHFAECVLSYSSKPEKVHITVEQNHLLLAIPNKKNAEVLLRHPLTLYLDKLRHSTKDDLQSIVAVHECGHAIAMITETGAIPDNIYSVTADAEAKGFVLSKEEHKFFTRKDIEHHIASMLGGYAAEELIFGQQNVTSGSASDIEGATKFAASMIKDYGFGDKLAQIRPEDIRAYLSLFDKSGEANDQVAQLLKKGYQLAAEMVKRESVLLIRMSSFLSDHSTMSPQKIREFIDAYGSVEIKNTIAKGNRFSYRKTLHLLNTGITEAEMLSPKSITASGVIVVNSNGSQGA